MPGSKKPMVPQPRPREVEERAAAIRAAERGNAAARRYAED